MTTKVVVDGRALYDGSAVRGIGTYLREVLKRFGDRSDLSVEALVPEGVGLPPGIAARRVRRCLPARLARAEHDLMLPFDLVKREGDVVHSPSQHPPRRCAMPWVQTLHDLIPLVQAGPGLAPERSWWRKVGPRLARASSVIVDSHYWADRVGGLLGLELARLHVIPLGVGPEFSPSGNRHSRSHPYVLMVSGWGDHKGFREAGEALGRLKAAGYPHRLLIGGHHDKHTRGLVMSAIGSIRSRVDFAGHLTELDSLYRGASALLVPSRCEGFGLPALEAMACGTPVVAFHNSSIPEVVGHAGLLVADGDVRALSEALASVVADENRRAEMVEAGLARAKEFTWEACAGATAEVLLSAGCA